MTFSTVNRSNLNSVHTAHLLTQLSRRLEVAKAHQNQSLVAALESEYAQLTAPAETTTLRDRFHRMWLSFASTLSEWTTVHIEQIVDGNGQLCWYAYDPQSEQAILTGSKRDMQQWINKQYWGC